MKVLLAVMILFPLALGSSVLSAQHPDQGLPIFMNKRPQPCCTPDQFEGTVGGMVGLQEGRLISDSIKYSYDRTNRRTNQNGISFSDGQATTFRVLALYDENRQYVVDSQGDCKYYTIGDFVPSCVPDNATYIGRQRIGIEEESADMDQWMFQAEGYQVILAVTPSKCFIMSQIAIGIYKPREEGVMSVFGLVNSTLGIKDPDVFTPPSNCEPGHKQATRPKAPFIL